MSYTRKLNYKDFLLVKGILFQQKDVEKSHKLVSAHVCKRLGKNFSKITELVEDARELSNLPGKKYEEPVECKDELMVEFNKDELLVIGSSIINIHSNREFAASTSFELLDITDKLILTRHVEKHCDVGKIDTTGFEIEEDSEDLKE